MKCSKCNFDVGGAGHMANVFGRLEFVCNLCDPPVADANKILHDLLDDLLLIQIGTDMFGPIEKYGPFGEYIKWALEEAAKKVGWNNGGYFYKPPEDEPSAWTRPDFVGPVWPAGKQWTGGPGKGYRNEYNCAHGVGHGQHIHGCDGCCRRPDYPYR